MKRLLTYIFILLVSLAAPFQTVQDSWATEIKGNFSDLITKGPWIDSRAYPTLTLTQIDAIAFAAGKLLLIAQNHTLTGNTVLTASVKVIPGGSFTYASTYTLTFSGGFDCPPNYQAFIGFTLGTNLFFSATAQEKIWREWLGLSSRNTNLGVGSGLLSTGGYNTGVGWKALLANITGYQNVAIGSNALLSNIGGYGNVAIGDGALPSNTSGYNNTAIGLASLYSNTTARDNTAVGSQSLFKNITGYENTAVGLSAMYENLSGASNTAIGDEALRLNTTGIQNTGIGMYSLYANTTGQRNTAVGFSSGNGITTTNNNIFLGWLAGAYETGNNKLFIDSLDRTTEALGRTNSLIYGIMDASASNQYLTVNAKLTASKPAGASVPIAAFYTPSMADTNEVYFNLGQDASASFYLLYHHLTDAASRYIALQNATVGPGSKSIVLTWNGNTGFGTTTPATKVDVAGSFQISSPVAGSLGGYVRTFAEATGTPSGTTTYFDIAVNVPAGTKLLGCQLRVDTALTAGETWGAAYVTGSSTILAATGQTVAKNTKVNKMHVDEITTDITKVRITRDAGNFTNSVGVIRAIVYYETFTAMDNL